MKRKTKGGELEWNQIKDSRLELKMLDFGWVFTVRQIRTMETEKKNTFCFGLGLLRNHCEVFQALKSYKKVEKI